MRSSRGAEAAAEEATIEGVKLKVVAIMAVVTGALDTDMATLVEGEEVAEEGGDTTEVRAELVGEEAAEAAAEEELGSAMGGQGGTIGVFV